MLILHVSMFLLFMEQIIIRFMIKIVLIIQLIFKIIKINVEMHYIYMCF